MKQDISIVRGTTNTFGIRITDANGDPFKLEDGQVLVFGIKKRPEDEDREVVKEISHAVDGVYYLELTPADTAQLDPGWYIYDVGLQQGDSVFYNIIKPSALYIIANVTELGDGA